MQLHDYITFILCYFVLYMLNNTIMGTNILIQESYILFVDQYMNENPINKDGMYQINIIKSFLILN
jgi:hypothetical protein